MNTSNLFVCFDNNGTDLFVSIEELVYANNEQGKMELKNDCLYVATGDDGDVFLPVTDVKF